jgi:hypothetical protein
MSSGIGDLVATLGMNSGGFSRGLGDAQQMLTDFGHEVAGIAGGMGVGFGLENIVSNVHSQIESLTTIGHTAEKFEMPVNSLIALQHQARMAHVEMGSLESGLGRMQKNMFEAATGTGEAGTAFKMLGIEINSIIGLSADQQFVAIAEGISKMDDATARADAAMKIFGKGGMELMNMLREGKVGFEEARKYIDDTGQVMSALDIENIQKSDQAIKELGESWSTFWKSVALGAGGPARDIVKGITDFDPTNMESSLAEMRAEHERLHPKVSEDTTVDKHASVALALEKQAKAEKDAKEARSEGARITESALTPLEKLNQEYKRGLELFGMGDITGDTLHRIQDRLTAAKDAESAKANEPFNAMQESVDRLEGSMRTPLQHARDDFNELWEAAEQGADVSEEAISTAFHRIGDESDAMREKLNKPYEQFEKGLHDAADRMHAELKTPLEKMQDKISEIRNNPFLSDVDKKRGIDKAAKGYHDQLPDYRAPSGGSLAGLTATSRELQQQIVDSMRADRGGDPDAAATAQATAVIAAAMPQLLKNTDPSEDIDPNTINASGDYME